MKIDKVVKPEAKVEYTQGKVVVELTFVEATVLLSLCYMTVTGNSGESSARGVTDEIGQRLLNAGVPVVELFEGHAKAKPMPRDALLKFLATGGVL